LASEAGAATTSETFTAGMVDWYLADNQGTVRDVAQSASGVTTIVDHVIFDSFGQATQGPGFTSDPLPEFTYNGTWQDPATGLNKMGKRWDDAVDDVFASQDPAGLKGGPNGFGGGQTNTEEYCGNSPTNYTDPTGEWSLFRWIYTGDGNASDQVYGVATEAAGQYYVQNAGDTHQALNQLGPLGAGTSAALKSLEGEDLHNAVVQQGQMANIPGGPGAQNPFPGGVLAPVPVPGINAPPPPPARPGENWGQRATRWVISAAPTVIAVVGMIIGQSGGASEEPVEGDPNGGGGPGGPGDEAPDENPFSRGGTRLPDDRIESPPTEPGRPPIGDDGKPVELHHDGQGPDSPLNEMTRTDHRGAGNFKENHSNTGQLPSQIDRKAFGDEREDYWNWEWDNGRWDDWGETE
jgi:RHS repeat-associated protein